MSQRFEYCLTKDTRAERDEHPGVELLTVSYQKVTVAASACAFIIGALLGVVIGLLI